MKKALLLAIPIMLALGACSEHQFGKQDPIRWSKEVVRKEQGNTYEFKGELPAAGGSLTFRSTNYETVWLRYVSETGTWIEHAPKTDPFVGEWSKVWAEGNAIHIQATANEKDTTRSILLVVSSGNTSCTIHLTQDCQRKE